MEQRNPRIAKLAAPGISCAKIRLIVRDGLRLRIGLAARPEHARVLSKDRRDKPTTPAPPWQNAVTDRLIGSIGRECSDHIVVFGEEQLRRMLRLYSRYYNYIRTHRSLDNDALASRPIQRTGSIRSFPILGRLHHH